jgi:hypothetical protein
MFKTCSTYLIIFSLMTSQLAALPPGTGETEASSSPPAAVSSSSTSTVQSPAAVEEGRQHKDNPNPAESIKPELKGMTSAITNLNSSLKSVDGELSSLRQDIKDMQTFNTSSISGHLQAMTKPLQTVGEELPKIATILNQHTLGGNEDRRLMGNMVAYLRSIDLVHCRAQSATVLILGVGMIVFCVYVSMISGDLHSIAGDIHRLADNSQSANLISQNSTANLQSLLEIFAKRP